jgi:hypothetical protein
LSYRFVWHDEARFKRLASEGEFEKSAITSFGTALGRAVVEGSEVSFEGGNLTADGLRSAILKFQPFVKKIGKVGGRARLWPPGV